MKTVLILQSNEGASGTPRSPQITLWKPLSQIINDDEHQDWLPLRKEESSYDSRNVLYLDLSGDYLPGYARVFFKLSCTLKVSATTCMLHPNFLKNDFSSKSDYFCILVN